VVHEEPGGPVVVEESAGRKQSAEEVERFLAGLDERLARLKGEGG